MDALQDLVAQVDGEAAVYARHLGTGETLAVGAVEEPFPTGSAAKYLVLLAFAERVATGTLDATARVTLEAAYRDQRKGSGVLRYLSAGLAPTLHDCATLMMIVSDNVATDLLLDALGGPAAVNDLVATLGVAGAEVTSPSVWVLPPAQFGLATAHGLAEAWSLLADAGSTADRCREITWRHQSKDGFSRLVPFLPDAVDFGFPSRLRLWAKAGSYPTVSCEAGLFETDHAQWVLAVMAKDLRDRGSSSASTGPTLRAEVSRLLYDAWG